MHKEPASLPGRRRRSEDAARVRDLLRTEIFAGVHGHVLPSEPELMLAFAVGRNVTREALDSLRDEGLIERIQGSGTFVIATKAQHRFDRVHSLHDSVSNSRMVGGQIRSMDTVTAPTSVARQLQLEPGSPCTYLTYTATVGDVAFSISASYVPLEIGERIPSDRFSGDFYQLLESVGFEVMGGAMTVEALAADSMTAQQLQVAPGAALLMFYRRLYGRDDRRLEVGFVRIPGDRLSLHMQLPRTHETHEETES